jgi:hypothetical protein
MLGLARSDLAKQFLFPWRSIKSRPVCAGLPKMALRLVESLNVPLRDRSALVEVPASAFLPKKI